MKEMKKLRDLYTQMDIENDVNIVIISGQVKAGPFLNGNGPGVMVIETETDIGGVKRTNSLAAKGWGFHKEDMELIEEGDRVKIIGFNQSSIYENKFGETVFDESITIEYMEHQTNLDDIDEDNLPEHWL